MRPEHRITQKHQAERTLSKIRKSGETILITEHDKPLVYLVDVAFSELQQNRIQILEGIARGERAILEDRTLSHEEAKRKLKKWLV